MENLILVKQHALIPFSIKNTCIPLQLIVAMEPIDFNHKNVIILKQLSGMLKISISPIHIISEKNEFYFYNQ